MLEISRDIVIPDSELEFRAVRSSGPGGQNVNKVSTAVHLRFDAGASGALPDDVRERLLACRDSRVTAAGVVNIKVQETRSQETNRQIALERLADLIRPLLEKPKPRKKTRPGRKAVAKRLDEKSRRARLKETRRKPIE